MQGGSWEGRKEKERRKESTVKSPECNRTITAWIISCGSLSRLRFLHSGWSLYRARYARDRRFKQVSRVSTSRTRFIDLRADGEETERHDRGAQASAFARGVNTAPPCRPPCPARQGPVHTFLLPPGRFSQTDGSSGSRLCRRRNDVASGMAHERPCLNRQVQRSPRAVTGLQSFHRN